MSSGHGKMPVRYAARSVPGSRSAPIPSGARAGASSAGGNAQRDGGGSIGNVYEASRLRAICET